MRNFCQYSGKNSVRWVQPNTPFKRNCFLRKMDFPSLHSSPEAAFLVIWIDTPVRMQSRTFHSGNKRLKTYIQTRPHEKWATTCVLQNPRCCELWAWSHCSFWSHRKRFPLRHKLTGTSYRFNAFHPQIQTNTMLEVRVMYLINSNIYTSPLQRFGGWRSPAPCREKSPVTLTTFQLRIENSTFHMWLGIRSWE